MKLFREIVELWDEDPALLGAIAGVAALVLMAMTAFALGDAPPAPVAAPAVEIVPEPHVITKSDLRWDLLERWPGATGDEEPAVEQASLEEEEPVAPRRHHHRHWRRW